MMTKYLLLSGLLLFGLQAFGQTSDDYIEVARTVLNTEKKAAIAETMMLSEAESGPFWDLYNEYNAKIYSTQNDRIAIIKDYANNYESLSDEKADELWKRAMKYRQDLLKLQKSYYKKFKKILPAGKAARYFQAENKIAALIDAELALNIPLVETN